MPEQEPTAVLTDAQEAPRKELIGASVNRDEKGRILVAFAQGGFRTTSEGGRKVLLAYAESAAVRDAVHAYLRDRRP